MAPLLEVRDLSGETRLPFDMEQQSALFGHVLRDERWYQRLRGRLKGEWFLDPYLAKLYKAWDAFYVKFQRVPTLNEFRSAEGLRELSPPE